MPKILQPSTLKLTSYISEFKYYRLSTDMKYNIVICVNVLYRLHKRF